MSVDTSAEDTPLNGDIIVTDIHACHELGLSLFVLLFLGTGVCNVFYTEFIAAFSIECVLLKKCSVQHDIVSLSGALSANRCAERVLY